MQLHHSGILQTKWFGHSAGMATPRPQHGSDNEDTTCDCVMPHHQHIVTHTGTSIPVWLRYTKTVRTPTFMHEAGSCTPNCPQPSVNHTMSCNHTIVGYFKPDGLATPPEWQRLDHHMYDHTVLHTGMAVASLREQACPAVARVVGGCRDCTAAWSCSC